MPDKNCKTIGCKNGVLHDDNDYCLDCCIDKTRGKNAPELPMAEKYPQYYKKVGQLTEIDVYAVHHLFDIQDPSGAIQHASKKLLLSGVRTGGKSQFKDIKEARDTLTRWLELNELVS